MKLKASLSAFVALAALASCMTGPGSGGAPTAKLDAGVVQGESAGDLAVFRGIPFAAPPVGDLRWRAPQPAAHWKGVRQATAIGAACPQPHVSDEPWARVGPQSEDCLFLNVWQPKKESAPLPVMVFIHGGSFRAGSGGVPLYDGTKLAQRGVVIVTINYRLGRIGFFAHPALTAENTDGLLGNYGLMDQIAALRWVQRNIAQFGGDPKNVMIFGESAGAVSVQAMMASPEARGLFAKAISESGGGYSVASQLKGATEKAGETWAAGVGFANATPEQLRSIPVDKIATAEGLVGAMIDGRILKDSPTKAFFLGEQAKVPLMIGGNSYESSLAGLDAAAKAVLGGAYNGLLAEYRTATPSRVGPEGDLSIQSVAIQPSRHLAEIQASKGQPSYTYYFTQQPASERTTKPGAEHGGELSYLFGTRLNAETWDAADEKVSQLMGDYWVRFARTGDPNGAGALVWEPVTTTSKRIMVLNDKAYMADATPLEDKVQKAGKTMAGLIWGPVK